MLNDLRASVLFACVLLLLALPRPAAAQTPSPLQEWQYSGGVILAKLFEPDLPKWRVVAGAAVEAQPVYDGSTAYRVEGGPAVNVQYRDVAFVSTGDGLGYNFLRGRKYQAGISLGYDLGRQVGDDRTNLHGMGDISPAPVVKLFGSYVLAKRFPLVLRVDVRQFAGGAHGRMGDVGAYLPLPGSSERFVMFAGPSITFADHHRMQGEFGVTPAQARASGHPVFDPHGGTFAAGVGFSATKFVGDHWLLNLDSAISQLRGSAAESPLTETRTQRTVALSVDYHW
jgi:outer membrane scaffolding protein for murein synthesis (MipA/OmpV family)